MLSNTNHQRRAYPAHVTWPATNSLSTSRDLPSHQQLTQLHQLMFWKNFVDLNFLTCLLVTWSIDLSYWMWFIIWMLLCSSINLSYCTVLFGKKSIRIYAKLFHDLPFSLQNWRPCIGSRISRKFHLIKDIIRLCSFIHLKALTGHWTSF